jgi:hypothetical protein
MGRIRLPFIHFYLCITTTVKNIIMNYTTTTKKHYKLQKEQLPEMTVSCPVQIHDLSVTLCTGISKMRQSGALTEK